MRQVLINFQIVGILRMSIVLCFLGFTDIQALGVGFHECEGCA